MKSAVVVLLIFSFFILPLPAYAQTATLSLSPASGTFNINCPFALQVNLDTGGVQTDGTDAILLYDQTKITATSIASGSIYPDYPGNNIDDASGKITISGLASVSSPFSGTGTLATVNFQVKPTAAPGATIIRFDFDPKDKAKTTDSNVVQRGTVADILNSVVDGNYIIGSGTCANPSASALPNTGAGGQTVIYVATPSGGQTTVQQTTVSNNALPNGGSEQFTYTVAIIGSVLTVMGILGLALL